MGIDLHCTDKRFRTSYSGWSEIKDKIILASFAYVQDKINKDIELYKNIDDDEDEHWVGEGSEYYLCMNSILEVKDMVSIKKTEGSRLNQLEQCFHQVKYVDAFIYFGLGGLFALCIKSDAEGYYSPGNSLDICNLLDLINPILSQYSFYDNIYTKEHSMYNLFRSSYCSNTKVRIS